MSQKSSKCVFVGNIPYDASEEQVRQILEEVGPVVSFRIVLDRETGKPKGYGFCEYRDEETAQSARRNLQGYDINGRQLRVDFAENDKGNVHGGGPRGAPGAQGGPGPGPHLRQQQQQFQQQPPGGGQFGPGPGGMRVRPGSQMPHQQPSAAPMHPIPGLRPVPQQGYGGPPPVQPHQAAMPLQQAQAAPMGMGAAAQAAAVVADALGAPPPPESAAKALPGGFPGVAAEASAKTPPEDPLTNQLAGMSKQQLYELLAQMKVLIETNYEQARAILVANPQLAKGLFQAQVMLGMVKPTKLKHPPKAAAQETVEPTVVQQPMQEQPAEALPRQQVRTPPPQHLAPQFPQHKAVPQVYTGPPGQAQPSHPRPHHFPHQPPPAAIARRHSPPLPHPSRGPPPPHPSRQGGPPGPISLGHIGRGGMVSGGDMGGRQHMQQVPLPQQQGGAAGPPHMQHMMPRQPPMQQQQGYGRGPPPPLPAGGMGMQYGQQQQQPGSFPPQMHEQQLHQQTGGQLPPAAQAPSMDLDQQEVLLQQVMSLTPEQINSLPSDQRAQVLQLQQALRQQ